MQNTHHKVAALELGLREVLARSLQELESENLPQVLLRLQEYVLIQARHLAVLVPEHVVI